MLSSLGRAKLNFKRNIRLASTAVSSTSRILSQYPIGLQIHGYSIEDVQPVPEFSLVAVKLQHLATGAQHLHLHSESDNNNIFLIGFKTDAPNATGVPHILEHTTLCGSYKYPERDPFFKMLNRSLANFMNALTGHDYTFYPFATTNKKDFENLMDVYLSSTLEPLLKYEDFLQEGWRLEQSDLDDKTSPILFKGVVYNEMKGQYSNSAYYYYIKFQENIYPALNNSGGDPKKITDLEYEDLLDFQSTNYHPSNAKTFTYGNFPLRQHLQTLNEWFGGFGKRTPSKALKHLFFQTEGAKVSSTVTCDGPFDLLSGKPIEEQFKSSVTWDLGNPLDELKQYDIFKWKILSSLLCDGHNAPFYQELIEKRFGDDFSSNSGLDSTTSLLSFTVGLDNLTKERVEGLELEIRRILTEKVIPEITHEGDNNVYDSRVLAILHQIELNFKKHKADFGLGLLNSIMPSWSNNFNPIQALQVETIINQFKQDYEENGLNIFTDMINETLLNDSTKKFTFIMEPNPEFEKHLEVDESQRLAKKVEKLSEEDIQIIYERSVELSNKQQSQDEKKSSLPTLTLADIPKKGDFHDLYFSSFGKDGNRKIQKRIVDSNGLSYMTAKKDISYIPERYYPYLPLFASCLTNLAGTERTPIHELETKIQQLTGGISFLTQVSVDPQDIFKTNLNLVLEGMALTTNLENVFDLWFDILLNTKFGTNDDFILEKLSNLIKNLGLNQLNTIADRGSVFANSFSNSLLLPSKYIADVKSGLRHIEFVKDLNKKLNERGNDFLVEELLPILKEIQDLLVKGAASKVDGTGFDYSLLGDKESIKLNEDLITKFESNLQIQTSPMSNVVSSIKAMGGDSHKTFIDLPFQIGFASMAKTGNSYLSKDGASLQVLSQLISSKHLHSIIREANGAYGGGLNYDGLGGALNFYSYRDPNPIKSIQSFKEVSDLIIPKIDQSWGSKEIQEAQLSIFQSVDAPSNISLQGSSNFLRGITDEMRQQRREWFLEVSKDDLKDVANKYIIGGDANAITVIGKKEEVELEEGWEIKEL